MPTGFYMTTEPNVPVVNPMSSVLPVLDDLRLHEPSNPWSSNSAVYDREWQHFLMQRTLLVNQILDRLGLSAQGAAASGVPGRAGQIIGEHTANQQVNQAVQQGAYQAPVAQDLNDLLGAARFYGIQDPEKIPPDVLQQMIRDSRLYMQQRRKEAGPEPWYQQAYDTLATGIGAIGLGMTHEIFKVAQRVPFIGDALARSQTIQDSDQWLAQMEEGFRGDLMGEDPKGFFDALQQIGQGNENAGWYVARGLSGMLGYSLPAAAAWRIAGAAGALGGGALGIGEAAGPMGFIGRSALQGAASAWMLEGGGDAPLQERALKIGVGAGFGAAWAVLPMVYGRIRASFPTAADRIPFSEPRPVGWEPPTVEGDWEFIRDPGELPPGGEPGPQGALPPGPPPTVGPGAGGPLQLEGYVARSFGEPMQPSAPAGPQPSVLDEFFNGVYGTPEQQAARRAAATWDMQVPSRPLALPPGQYNMPAAPEPPLPPEQATRVAASQAGRAGLANVEFSTPEPTPFGPPKGPPQPLPPVTGVDPALVQPAWDVVSARYPRLARTISAIQPLPQRYIGQANAMYGDRTGAIYVDPSSPVSPATLFHELTHAAQRQIGLIGPDVPVTPEYAQRMEAFAYRTGNAYLTAQQAAADAQAMTKHNTLMESPALADMATQPRYDDFDVARAAVATRPAGVSVIQGVGDVAKFVQQALRGQIEGGIGPQDFRVVALEGPTGPRTDVLVASGRAVSNKMVQQYKQYGMFVGQQATVNGTQVEIEIPAGPDGVATVRSVYGGEPFQVRGDQVLPARGSAGVFEAPRLYNDFRNYSLAYMHGESDAAGIPRFHWTSSEVSSQLPRLLKEFLDDRGITDNLTRAAVSNYFERMRVNDFRDLVPDDAAEAATMRAQAADAVIQAQMEGRTLERLPALAEEKGFNVDVDPRDGAVVLHDALSDLVVPVGSEDDAIHFLSNFHRDMPDLTPAADVPAELVESVPGGVHPGTSTDYEPMDPGEQNHWMQMAVNRANQVAQGGGGAGTPPGQPPQLGTGGGGGPPQLGGNQNLGQQFRRLARDDPERFQQMLDQMTSQAAQLFLPMRNWTLRGEEILHNFGIDRGVMWQQYNRATTGLDIAHNELTPYYNELNDIIRTFRRRLVRTGIVRDVMEASGPQAKLALMQQHGFTPDEQQAIDRLNFFTHRVWYEARQAGFDIGYIPDYMPRLRAARVGGGDPFSANMTIGQQGQVFFEYARQGNLDVRERDAGVLLTHWVRSWKMAQHVTPALNDIIDTWQLNVPEQASSIPADLRRVLNDWVRVVRFGHGPEHEFAIQGVRRTLNAIGIPVTDGEVVHLYGTAFTNAYRSQLGFRPDVWFRDSIQPLLSGAKIGFGPVRETYMDFFRNPQARAEMWDRALRGGWVVHGMVKVPTAEVFETQPTGAAGADVFTPEQAARREMIARLGDVTHDLTPQPLRGGIQGSWLDPLLVYTKEGEFNRLISGEAGWRRATRAIQQWQSAGAVTTQDALQQVSLNAGAMAWRGPVQREFQRLLTAGSHDEAANLLANEAANMQFRYGTREASPAIQRAGMKGRFAMMFGTFTNQYMANMAELMARDIPAAERARFLVRYGSVVAALAAASAATGWNFGKWQWHQSTTFAGGPPMHGLIKAWDTLTGLYTAARNTYVNEDTHQEYITPEQQTQLTQLQEQAQQPGQGFAAPIAMGVAETFFPYSGGLRTVRNIGSAIASPGTAETLPQFILTGERPERSRAANAQDYFTQMGTAHQEAMDSLLRSNSMPGGGSRY